MKNFLWILSAAAIIFPASLLGQINSVIIERYYVSDAKDATDTINGNPLPEGSKTYRVYIDLKPGSRLKKIYGDTYHVLKISSTANFYNNLDRPAAYFGYNINRNWFQDNPTLALDSWLTLGLAERTHSGILKANDSDGSFVGGIINNNGGTALIPEGLLNNNDISCGIPLTSADGFAPANILSPTWSDFGFRDNISGGTDTTIFGIVNSGASFVSDTAYLQQNTGVIGAAADSNKVLVAQLTTLGEISFELNIVLIEPDGASTKDVKYVARFANGESNSDNLHVSPSLTYPPVCGCTDPHYLEYSAAYACNNSDSCRTLIVLGCMDVSACNYKPEANFSVPSLCCYPGYCNDRDIALVCPSLNDASKRFNLYPNPAHSYLNLHVSPDNDKEVKYFIYNSLGKLVLEENLGVVKGTIGIDISNLNPGVHLFRIITGDVSESKMFFKK